MKHTFFYIVSCLIGLNLHAQSLNEMLIKGAENNTALKSAYKEYEAALQNIDQVGTLPNPTLDFGYFISPVETRNGPQQAKIGIMQMFPWLGTLSAREEVSALIAKAKYEAFESQKKKLFFRIKQAWYEMEALYQSKKILQQHLNILESYESLATQKFETGSTSGMVDVLRIQMELAELNNQVLLIEDKTDLKQVQINNLLNQDPGTTISIPGEQSERTMPYSKFASMDTILTSNNELRGLDIKRKAAVASGNVSRKQGLPTFGVGLNYFMIGETGLAAPNSGRDALMPMISIGVPVYRKKYRAQIKEAELTAESIGFTMENKENELHSLLESAWVNYTDADRRIKLFRAQKIKAEQARDITVSSYTNSGKDFEEILRIQRMMLMYDLNVIQAIRDKNISISKIESMQ